MIVIGLTGSIGMGKSTVAKQFRACGAAVCDSDAIVHRLLAPKGAAAAEISRLFPGTVKSGVIDRKLLGKEVFGNNAKLRKLEAALHPLVHEAQDRFIRRARAYSKKVVVLDIPLLFETGGEERCDATVVATAPAALQRQRVFRRTHMTEEKFAQILSRQMKDSEKRRRADFIVHTGQGKSASLKEVRRIIAYLLKKPSHIA